MLLFLCALCVSALSAASCHRGPPNRQVILYTSCDDYLLREVVAAFEKETGIAVRAVGDTEATKTTGLVQRLLDEKDHPRADVWWSNEPFGTVKLERNGVLEPYTSKAEADFKDGWPAWLRGRNGTWYGFALRCRVIVYNTKKLSREQVPTRLQDLANPEWKGRIGMARPQFGTTRGEMGSIVLGSGPDAFRDWVKALKANSIRLYDGNSSVVRAAATGEIDIGLTDSDDVYAGQHEGWPVDQVRTPGSMLKPTTPGLVPMPSLPIPNTVAKVKGAPHPSEAAALIDFLVSERVERILAQSDSRNTPVRPTLAAELRDRVSPMSAYADFTGITLHIPEALGIWDDVFGR